VKYQSSIAGIGLTLCAILLVIAAVAPLGTWGTIGVITAAGFLGGIIIPSRDLLVRQASPPKAVGRTFGIVTTGFNFGGIIAPVLGGVLIDNHLPAWIFYASAAFTIITVVIALIVDRRARD
jgi:MFS family permease